jgi:hypothetical protein
MHNFELLFAGRKSLLTFMCMLCSGAALLNVLASMPRALRQVWRTMRRGCGILDDFSNL